MLSSLPWAEDAPAVHVQVPGNKKAIGQQYNVCSDRYVTFDGIVKSLAAAAGVEPGMLLYDPKAVKLEKGEGFPFRTNHFFAQVCATYMFMHAGHACLPASSAAQPFISCEIQLMFQCSRGALC